MADIGATSSATQGANVEQIKRDLEGFRELLLPVKRVLEWEQNYYPAVLVGVITFVFAVIWYLEPSVLTTVCLLGVIVCVADFSLPLASSYLFRNKEWGASDEREFSTICERISHAKQHFHDFLQYMTELKKEKPKVYLMVLIGTFAVFAWLGSLIDNLLLTYLLVVGVVMIPGLRKHGILQKVTSRVKDLAVQLKKSGQEKLNKTKAKTN